MVARESVLAGGAVAAAEETVACARFGVFAEGALDGAAVSGGAGAFLIERIIANRTRSRINTSETIGSTLRTHIGGNRREVPSRTKVTGAGRGSRLLEEGRSAGGAALLSA